MQPLCPFSAPAWDPDGLVALGAASIVTLPETASRTFHGVRLEPTPRTPGNLLQNHLTFTTYI